MKLIIVLGSIVTIILVTLPVLESTKLSANDRVDKFINLQTSKYNVINKYLSNYIIENAFRILSKFVLNEREMYEFAKHLNETGVLPKWSKQQELKNPKFYELLRYDITVELIPQFFDDVIQRVHDLKTKIFHDSPDVSIERLCKVYVRNKLNEIISLPDYYALIVLFEDRQQLKLHKPVGWRIKRALFSLAIRQYNSDLISTFSPVTCFHEKLVIANSINDIKTGSTIEFNDFLTCHNNNIFHGKHLKPIKESESTKNWISYKIVVTDPSLIVNFDEFRKNEEDDFNIILPNVVFMAMKDPILYDTSYGLTAFLTIESKPIVKRSEWLASMANAVEHYKEKEEAYLNDASSK